MTPADGVSEPRPADRMCPRTRYAPAGIKGRQGALVCGGVRKPLVAFPPSDSVHGPSYARPANLRVMTMSWRVKLLHHVRGSKANCRGHGAAAGDQHRGSGRHVG